MTTIVKNCCVCGEPQTIEAPPAWLMGIKIDIACDKCDRQMRIAARVEAHRIARESAMMRTGIPAKYRDYDAERDPSGLFEWLLGNAGNNVLLSGPNGVGKTHAMAHAAFQLADGSNNHVRWLFLPGWISETCSAMGSDGDAAQQAIRNAERAGLLVLDDMGKERATPRSGEVLFCLLDCRLREGRPTWITSNFNGKEISAKYGDDHGPAILSRLRREDFKTFDWGMK